MIMVVCHLVSFIGRSLRSLKPDSNMNWIGSQTPAVIASIIFAICYTAAAVIFATLRILARTRFAQGVQEITPAMVTPIGVIGGLLIAFLAARVWSNVDHADAYVVQEANAVREMDRLADELPGPVRQAVRHGRQRM
jgi:hypothetical protein